MERMGCVVSIMGLLSAAGIGLPISNVALLATAAGVSVAYVTSVLGNFEGEPMSSLVGESWCASPYEPVLAGLQFPGGKYRL